MLRLFRSRLGTAASAARPLSSAAAPPSSDEEAAAQAAGLEAARQLGASGADKHFRERFGAGEGSVAEVEDAIRSLGVDRAGALQHLGADCHNAACAAYRDLAFGGVHFASEEEAAAWEAAGNGADGGVMGAALAAAAAHQSALRLLGPVLPLSTVWNQRGGGEDGAEVGEAEGGGAAATAASASASTSACVLLDRDAKGEPRPAADLVLPPWPAELDEASALAGRLGGLARASCKLLLAQGAPAPGVLGSELDAVDDNALFSADGLGATVCARLDGSGGMGHPVAAMLVTNFALLGSVVNLRVMLASRLGSALYPQLLAWCDVIFARSALAGEEGYLPRSLAKGDGYDGAFAFGRAGALLAEAPLTEVTPILGELLAEIAALAASWDRDAGARADWPDAGGSVEEARAWMVERYAEVDVRLAAVAKLALLLPGTLAPGSPLAAQGMARASRETFEAAMGETRWLPGSQCDEALEGLRAIEEVYS